MPTCASCQSPFEVTNEDRVFFEKTCPIIAGRKYLFTDPTLCPSCRHQRRLSFRNERNLYKRTCDLCGKTMISMFNTNSPYKVYCKECFYSDKWDPLEYGRDFDFNRSFFDQFAELFEKVPKAALMVLDNDNCEYNNYLAFSKNTYMSPGSYRVENCYYSNKSQYLNNCVDNWSIDHCEYCYECINCNNCYELFFSRLCRNCSNSYFLKHCNGCKNCFMCCNLRNKEYYFQNKAFSKEEYENLVPKIIEQMKKTSEWGEFFPMKLSPFAYNETVAYEYFPMKKEELEVKGFRWKEDTDHILRVTKIIEASRLPNSIEDIPDDIQNWAIKCEATGRPFKIISHELAFYRKFKLPIPHFHPEERYLQRLHLRNPQHLWDRICAKCGKNIVSSYAQGRPEIVYCSPCLIKEIY